MSHKTIVGPGGVETAFFHVQPQASQPTFEELIASDVNAGLLHAQPQARLITATIRTPPIPFSLITPRPSSFVGFRHVGSQHIPMKTSKSWHGGVSTSAWATTGLNPLHLYVAPHAPETLLDLNSETGNDFPLICGSSTVMLDARFYPPTGSHILSPYTKDGFDIGHHSCIS